MGRATAGRAIVAGAVAQRAGYGGHAWALLPWVVGLQQLGWDVVFVDRLDASGAMGDEATNLRWLSDVAAFAGVARWAVLHEDGRVTSSGAGAGSRAELLEHARSSEFVLDVMGFLDDDELLAAPARRVFLDIDPGFGQMWCDLGLHDPFRGHDSFVTVGLRVGRTDADCTVPTCGLDWVPTPPPVVLDQWPVAPGPGEAWTSVASWRGPNAPIEHGGRTYGLRVHEFRRFVALPSSVDRELRLALDIDDADQVDRDLLLANGWRLVEPAVAAGTMERYRAFVGGSRGELLVAKQLYVATRGGWVSDRSACYLAAGRPVVAQDTGLADVLPVGEGLVVFDDPDGAAAAIAEVEADYDRHRKAARDLAAGVFDARRVVSSLLDRGALA